MNLANNTEKLLSLLCDKGWVEVADLASSMQLPRQEILAMLQCLLRWGYVLDCQDGSWCLQHPRHPLLRCEIEALLRAIGGDSAWPEVIVMPTCGSTSEEVYAAPHRHFNKIVVLAEAQTQGKGRRSRHWHSPFGENIYLSLRTEMAKTFVQGLSLAICVTVTRALQQLGVKPCRLSIKWPNDVLIDGHKVGGILVELAHHQEAIEVVIGLGLNVNMKQSRQINQTWTALNRCLDEEIDRNLVASHLIAGLSEDLVLFQREGLLPFLSEWRALTCHHGQHIYSEQLQKVGRYQDVDEQGRLVLEMEQGEIALVDTGSVRGVDLG